MPRYVKKWSFWAETGKNDQHGKIGVDAARLKSSTPKGPRVYRRRQRNCKDRFLFWSDEDPTPRASLGDVVGFLKGE